MLVPVRKLSIPGIHFRTQNSDPGRCCWDKGVEVFISWCLERGAHGPDREEVEGRKQRSAASCEESSELVDVCEVVDGLLARGEFCG